LIFDEVAAGIFSYAPVPAISRMASLAEAVPAIKTN
jgi:hypothetical protein